MKGDTAVNFRRVQILLASSILLASIMFSITGCGKGTKDAGNVTLADVYSKMSDNLRNCTGYTEDVNVTFDASVVTSTKSDKSTESEVSAICSTSTDLSVTNGIIYHTTGSVQTRLQGFSLEFPIEEYVANKDALSLSAAEDGSTILPDDMQDVLDQVNKDKEGTDETLTKESTDDKDSKEEKDDKDSREDTKGTDGKVLSDDEFVYFSSKRVTDDSGNVNNEWTRTYIPKSSALGALLLEKIEKNSFGLSLDEHSVLDITSDTYTLKSEMGYLEFSSMLNSDVLSDTVDSLSTDDRVPVILKVNKETCLPESLVIDFSNSSYETAVTNKLVDTKTDVKKFIMTVNFSNFGEGTDIDIPENVQQEGALTTETSDDVGDGEVLEEGTVEDKDKKKKKEKRETTPSSDGKKTYVSSIVTNPLKVGSKKWCKSYIYNGTDETYGEVGVYAKKLFRGADVNPYIDEWNAKCQVEEDKIGAAGDGLEWVVLEYQVYLPENFNVPEGGLIIPDIPASIKGTDGGVLHYAEKDWSDLPTVNLTGHPQVDKAGTKVTYHLLMAVPSGCTDYLFEMGTYGYDYFYIKGK